jgi:predicted amidohydrolase
VIENGRAIDPETNTDQILNVGVKDGTIAKLSDETILL